MLALREEAEVPDMSFRDRVCTVVTRNQLVARSAAGDLDVDAGSKDELVIRSVQRLFTLELAAKSRMERVLVAAVIRESRARVRRHGGLRDADPWIP
jgi:hypothetical protein